MIGLLLEGKVDFKRFTNKENLKQMTAHANWKWIAGVVILIVGIILFILSVHAMKQIADANTLSQNFSNFFEHNTTWNPIIKFFGGKAQEKIEYYNKVTLIIQIGGVALTALGAVMVVVFRKKKVNKDKK